MQYRRMGHSGLRLSVLSLGSWVTYHNQVDVDAAVEMMAIAYDAGVNFFDNAEGYALGHSEEVMGAALKRLGWPRLNYVVSSKYYWGLDRGTGDGVNRRNTLNRKYLMQAVDGSLRRMGLDHLDLIYCHRPDPHTPVDETVRAMNDLIVQGKALYWGTSEWSAADIRTAWQLADSHGWHRPVVEQPQYNLLHRHRVEHEYAPLYDEIGLGLTTWSPLASGLLTGTYRGGMPDDSRGAMPSMAFLRERLLDEPRNAAVGRLVPIADALGCTLAQLAIAWSARNPNVTSVITGASRPDQLKANLAAVQVLERLTDDAVARIETVTAPLAS
ncbi:MAG: potassium channel beta subunit family protein [Aquabacterium sp.]